MADIFKGYRCNCLIFYEKKKNSKKKNKKENKIINYVIDRQKKNEYLRSMDVSVLSRSPGDFFLFFHFFCFHF